VDEESLLRTIEQIRKKEENSSIPIKVDLGKLIDI